MNQYQALAQAVRERCWEIHQYKPDDLIRGVTRCDSCELYEKIIMLHNPASTGYGCIICLGGLPCGIFETINSVITRAQNNRVDIDELADLMRLNPDTNPTDIKEFLQQEASERVKKNGI